MGEVYSARDTRLDRTVAIKLLPAHLAADEQLRPRFGREAKAVSSLNRLHICTIHDVGHEMAGGDDLAHYRPTPDGQRFLVLSPLHQETVPATTVVLNWTAGLR
jgi:serine/threonine protein kinase